VLGGSMSLVGPRPHAVAHNTEYERVVANYAFRYHVKPGISGWAQVNGFRGETSTVDLMEKRVEFGSSFSQASISSDRHMLRPPKILAEGNRPALISPQIVGKVAPAMRQTSALLSRRTCQSCGGAAGVCTCARLSRCSSRSR
jgi:hypothetical protein